ncbi:uncharacterized protein LOC113298808 [Papaver somniferum]|uniref:uncharacterized protein LOC113298808 n=1 Tax=Papaver somniferum TaxID=3469 RepID=UPI000E7038FF|nr:uncharacterized protein LOC113298808 [Papaver somniferum]
MVITLGTCSWRNITTTTAEISPPPGSSPFPSRMVTRVSRSFFRPATFCGGDLLWRTTSEVGNNHKIEMLLSFDLHNEKIQFIRLPAESTPTTTMSERHYLVVDHLLEFKGYPCIARSEKIMISNSDHSGHRCDYQSNLNCCCCCKVHMYILKDKVKQVWIREETFDVQIKDQEGLLPAPLCSYFDTGAVTPPTRLLTLSDQVLLYWFNGECLILYNLLEKYLKVVKCSHSYPEVFRAQMNETLARCIGDDNNIYCPYTDYQLHAQVENLVSMKTFIPKGAKTSKYDSFEDFQHAIKGNPPAGCVDMGRESLNCYAFREDKEVDDEVSDNVEGHRSESCRSKQCRSKKMSGKAKRTLNAKKSKKVQSTGSESSELISACQSMIDIITSNYVSDPVPVEKWMAVLKEVPDLDVDLKLDAVDFLEGDPVVAQTFVAVSPDLRKRWLTRKLRGN